MLSINRVQVFVEIGMCAMILANKLFEMNKIETVLKERSLFMTRKGRTVWKSVSDEVLSLKSLHFVSDSGIRLPFPKKII